MFYPKHSDFDSKLSEKSVFCPMALQKTGFFSEFGAKAGKHEKIHKNMKI